MIEIRKTDFDFIRAYYRKSKIKMFLKNKNVFQKNKKLDA